MALFLETHNSNDDTFSFFLGPKSVHFEEGIPAGLFGAFGGPFQLPGFCKHQRAEFNYG